MHPVTYIERGSVIVRADAQGRARIPGRIHLRPPLPLSMPPMVFIDHVYLPRLHSAFGPIAEGTTSRPGVFTIDDGREHVTVFDVSQDPERWACSLGYLFDCIRQTLSRDGSMAPASPGDTRTAATRANSWAISGLSMQRSSTAMDRPRADVRPGLWEDPNATGNWDATDRGATGREPLWGPYFERTWRNHLTELASLEASLK